MQTLATILIMNVDECRVHLVFAIVEVSNMFRNFKDIIDSETSCQVLLIILALEFPFWNPFVPFGYAYLRT